MDKDTLIVLGPIIGVVAGSLGTVLVTWITKHYEEQSTYRKIIIDSSMDYFKEALIAARETARSTHKIAYAWPYESFIISISHLVNKVVNKDFDIDKLNEIIKESKKLRESLNKLYSKKGIKYGDNSTS